MQKNFFMVRISDIDWRVEHYFPYVKDRLKDYLISDEEESTIIISSDFEAIRRIQKEHPDFDEDYAESDCIYQRIGESLPLRNRMLLHGAVITYGEDAFLFTAPSGTGKSTHIALWRKYLGSGVEIVNGDKPIVSVEDQNPGVTVYGTPWGGKENWQKNRKAPLRAVCLIRQAKENAIQRIDPGEYLGVLMQQVYLPSSEEAGGRTLELLDELMRRVPFYLLQCDMSEDAVRCSFEELTRKKYETKTL